MREREAEIDDNIGSDSDPSGDEYEQAELKKMLPKLFNIKKQKKKKIMGKNKKPEVEKKVEKEEVQEGPKLKKINHK